MHRAVAARGLGRQPEHVVEIAQADGLEVVEPAEAAAGLDDVRRRAEARPFGGQQHRHQVAAGRMAGDRDARRIAAERAGVGVHPRDRRAYLAYLLVQVHGRHQRVVHDDGRGLAERARDEREVGLVEAVPVAAVDEDVHRRRAGSGGGEDVGTLGVVGAVRHVELHRQFGAGARARGAVARDPVHRVLDLRAVVVLGVERRPVVVAEHVHAAPLVERAGAATRRASRRAAGRAQKVSGSVRRTQRPPFTTARNEEFAPWCLSGPKLTSGPLKMSL